MHAGNKNLDLPKRKNNKNEEINMTRSYQCGSECGRKGNRKTHSLPLSPDCSRAFNGGKRNTF